MKAIVASVCALLCSVATAADCPSTATIRINSSNYAGEFAVELRRGNRPGSKLIARRKIATGGVAVFPNICPGTYFFSFGTDDSDQVSITRYFPVNFDGTNYNNPTITVIYTKVLSNESQRVGTAKRKEL